jgi:hypothetical protein
MAEPADAGNGRIRDPICTHGKGPAAVSPERISGVLERALELELCFVWVECFFTLILMYLTTLKRYADRSARALGLTRVHVIQDGTIFQVFCCQLKPVSI